MGLWPKSMNALSSCKHRTGGHMEEDRDGPSGVDHQGCTIRGGPSGMKWWEEQIYLVPKALFSCWLRSEGAGADEQG